MCEKLFYSIYTRYKQTHCALNLFVFYSSSRDWKLCLGVCEILHGGGLNHYILDNLFFIKPCKTRLVFFLFFSILLKVCKFMSAFLLFSGRNVLSHIYRACRRSETADQSPISAVCNMMNQMFRMNWPVRTDQQGDRGCTSA